LNKKKSTQNQHFCPKLVTPNFSGWFLHFFALGQPQTTPFSYPWLTFAAPIQVTQISYSRPMKNTS